MCGSSICKAARPRFSPQFIENKLKFFPDIREAVAFENPDIDPMDVTISGSPERCASRTGPAFSEKAGAISGGIVAGSSTTNE